MRGNFGSEIDTSCSRFLIILEYWHIQQVTETFLGEGPFIFRLNSRFKSCDRLELLQSGYLRDASGELIGSLLNFENLKHLTNYMKTPNNKGIHSTWKI